MASSAKNKTQPTDDSVSAFLDALTDEQLKSDSRALVTIMSGISGHPARMWGTSIIGFDQYHYRYESGRQGDSAAIGFSPRRTGLVLYLGGGLERHERQLSRLGKHSTGKGCLYIKRLSDVNEAVLRELVGEAYTYIKSRPL